MPVKSTANTAFYPLSGADFVNLYAFYPDANANIMVGLEPAGKITDPNTLTAEQLKQGLNSIQSMVGEMAAQNYFTRKRMRREFANPHFSGTSPVLLIFMTRLGLKTGITGKTVVVQGLGNVGYHTAKFFREHGALVVGLAEYEGAIYNANGLNSSVRPRKNRSNTPDIQIAHPDSATIISNKFSPSQINANTKYFNISIDSGSNFQIDVYDSGGKLIKEKSIPAGGPIIIDGLPDENLLVIARANRKMLAERIVVRR